MPEEFRTIKEILLYQEVQSLRERNYSLRLTNEALKGGEAEKVRAITYLQTERDIAEYRMMKLQRIIDVCNRCRSAQQNALNAAEQEQGQTEAPTVQPSAPPPPESA